MSVTLRDKPHLHNSPVAVTPAGREGIFILFVCYSDALLLGGTSEISSCNYIARKRGLKSRMYCRCLCVRSTNVVYRLVKDARVLCPELVVLTCEFDKYKKVWDRHISHYHLLTVSIGIRADL